MKKIYTIGYDSREFDSFLRTLMHYGIMIVIDVRRFPKSRIEYYSRDFLEENLPKHGIEYFWLGDKLGGFRGDYIEYMKTPSFREGIKQLIEIVENGYSRNSFSVIMCREMLPWHCHRRFIAAALHSLGYRIVHIIDRGNTIEQGYGLEKYGLDLKDLFPNH